MEIAAIKSQALPVKLEANLGGKVQSVSFQSILGSIRKKFVSANKPDVHLELLTLQKKVMQNQNIPARDLLVYQVKASQLRLKVELTSKVAESMLATTRRLQQGQ